MPISIFEASSSKLQHYFRHRAFETLYAICNFVRFREIKIEISYIKLSITCTTSTTRCYDFCFPLSNVSEERATRHGETCISRHSFGAVLKSKRARLKPGQMRSTWRDKFGEPRRITGEIYKDSAGDAPPGTLGGKIVFISLEFRERMWGERAMR